jgi:hypothetical protein
MGDTCSVLELFDQVARQARIPIGFESARGCWLGSRSAVPASGARTLRARTAREAFDEIAELSGAFSWRDANGVVVIRPAGAWREAGFLSLRVGAFHMINVSLDEALCRALDEATPRVRYERPRRSRPLEPIEIPMSVDFSGGTLMDALTAIVRAKGSAEWQVAYSNGRAGVLISALDTLDTSATALVTAVAWTSPPAAATVARR